MLFLRHSLSKTGDGSLAKKGSARCLNGREGFGGKVVR